MARLAAQEVAGYYKTPTHLLGRIAALVGRAADGHTSFVDPCAGDGEAILTLAERLCDRSKAAVYTVELEVTRHAAMQTRIEHLSAVAGAWHWKQLSLRGDAFCVRATRAIDSGASLLFLNPPYDTDRDYKRLENRFLVRFLDVLTEGGVLLYLVPHYALAPSADFLAKHATLHGCFRFPDPDFEVYKQVVLVATRVQERLAPEPRITRRVLAWSESVEGMSELPREGGRSVVALPAGDRWRGEGLAKWALEAVDVQGLASRYALWHATTRGGARTPLAGFEPEEQVEQMLLRTYPVATPPRPAHIAAGIASGLFNGARVESKEKSFPPLLVKGVFDREYKTVDEKTDKGHGNVTALVQVQQPKLVTTILDLRTLRYHVLGSTTEETRTNDVASMTVADLLTHYGESLMGVMRRQCPVLYDPLVGPRLRLAKSPRKLFTAQAHAVRALVRLLQRGNAILLGEIGCLGLGTRVMMFDGSTKAVEEVVEGDLLMGPDSKPRTVLQTKRGRSSLFEVVPTVGESWVCNDEHVLTLIHTMSDDVFDITVDEYLSSRRIKRALSKGGRRSHPREEFKQFFPSGGVDFPPRDAPAVDPYFLGVWYGDGDHTPSKIAVTTADEEIRECLVAMASERGLELRCYSQIGNRARRFVLTRGPSRSRVNTLLHDVRRLYGDGERLPAACTRGSRETRRQFLAGLIDTDGFVYGGCCCDFVQKRRAWAEDVAFVARSLGIRATIVSKVVNGETYWRVSMSGDLEQLPMRIRRKQASARSTHRRNRYDRKVVGSMRRQRDVCRTGIELRSLGKGEYAGFMLDGDGRFLLGDFTVTHNSGKSTCSLLAARTIGARRPLILCPPHLLQSWKNEIAAVLPGVEAHVMSTVADVQAFAALPPGPVAVAILSREAAKLGHAWRSVEGTCPRCGTELDPEEDYAKKRSRCDHRTLVPTDRLARAADDLAEYLAPFAPGNSDLQSMLRGRHAKRRLAILNERRSPDFHGLPAERVIDVLAWLVDMLPERRDLARRAIVMLLLAVGDDDLTLRVATAVASLESDRSYDLFATDLVMLVADDARRTAFIDEQKARFTGYSNPWARSHEEMAEVRNGQSWHRIGEQPLSWKDGSLCVGGNEARSIGAAVEAMACVARAGRYVRTPACGETLFQAVPEPRRFPLAKYISRYYADAFDFLIVDEGHEYASDSSAQAFSAHRLTGLGLPTILMTGTVMNGYAESLFVNMWAMAPDFRTEFARDEKQRFIDRYGYRKRIVEDRQDGKVVEYGAQSDRVQRSERIVGNAPGVLPLFLLRHLLPIAVTLHKADLAIDLPTCTQERVLVEPTTQLKTRFERLQTALIQQIKRDRFREGLAGKLWGQLAELPSYLDRATRDIGNCERGAYEIRYPEHVEGGALVASEEGLESSTILPKEQWMLDTVARELREGRRVMVFAWHVSLLPRYARLIERMLAHEPVPILFADKVGTAKRQEWIDTHVVKKNRRVLVTNPVAIQTGLNNLVHFASEVWMENPACNPVIYRQAIGRVDRIGQKLPTRIFFPVYAGTLQQKLYDLLAKKVAISISTDGLDPETMLVAAGVGESDALAALSIGRQLWAMMNEEAA